MTIFGKNSAIFSKIGKVNLLNWDFSANWECSRSIGNFFSQLGKKFGTGHRTQFCIEKKPCDHNIQTSFSLKPLGQLKPNFMCSILRKSE